MNHILHWLAMGGYARYVWPAYGVMVAVFVLNGVAIHVQRKKTFRQLHQWFRPE